MKYSENPRQSIVNFQCRGRKLVRVEGMNPHFAQLGALPGGGVVGTLRRVRQAGGTCLHRRGHGLELEVAHVHNEGHKIRTQISHYVWLARS